MSCYDIIHLTRSISDNRQEVKSNGARQSPGALANRYVDMLSITCLRLYPTYD